MLRWRHQPGHKVSLYRNYEELKHITIQVLQPSLQRLYRNYEELKLEVAYPIPYPKTCLYRNYEELKQVGEGDLWDHAHWFVS